MVNGSVLCFHTKPPEFLDRATVIKDVSASYARCLHYTHSAFISSRACGSRFKCLYCSIFARVILEKSFNTNHMPCSARISLDPPFTAPSQSPSTSSSLLFPSNWTSIETPLLGRFA